MKRASLLALEQYRNALRHDITREVRALYGSEAAVLRGDFGNDEVFVVDLLDLRVQDAGFQALAPLSVAVLGWLDTLSADAAREVLEALERPDFALILSSERWASCGAVLAAQHPLRALVLGAQAVGLLGVERGMALEPPLDPVRLPPGFEVCVAGDTLRFEGRLEGDGTQLPLTLNVNSGGVRLEVTQRGCVELSVSGGALQVRLTDAQGASRLERALEPAPNAAQP